MSFQGRIPTTIGAALIVVGIRPWEDMTYLYSLMTIMLSALVGFTVFSEFIRGGRVIKGHTGQSLFASMVQLAHRNTRRHGGALLLLPPAALICSFSRRPL